MKPRAVDFRRADLNAGSVSEADGDGVDGKEEISPPAVSEVAAADGGGIDQKPSLKRSFVEFFPRLVACLVDVPERALGRAAEVNWWSASAIILAQSALLPQSLTAKMTYPLFAACRLVLGTLYPAYASYKAVRTKNVREYVSTLTHTRVDSLQTLDII